jgi:HK97 gp10 family phage protein
MPETVTVNITGLDELQKKLEEELPKDARLALRIALSAGAGDIKSAMVDAAPVEADGENAGFLRDHLKVKTIIRRDELAGVAIVGATEAVYPGRAGKQGRVSFKTASGKLVDFVSKHAGQVTAARVARFLEFGTSKMSAKPFMTPAYESTKETAFNHVVAKLREVLKLN